MRRTIWANEMLLDHVITTTDGDRIGMVDDLELSDPGNGAPPQVTALLCGPAALGPRIGGRLGMLWATIGARLRPDNVTEPTRVPVELIIEVNHRGVHVEETGERIGTQLLHDWLRDHIIARIPGHGAGG